MASRILNLARTIDDFIIDRALQPAVNLARWYLDLPHYTLARLCVVLGGGTGLIWLHRFGNFPSPDFYEDVFSLGLMVACAYLQIRLYEAREPRRDAAMPAARPAGFLWRTLWLLDLAVFPCQWPVEPHDELTLNFMWTFLLVLPYWIICCRRPPPLERRQLVPRPVTIPAR